MSISKNLELFAENFLKNYLRFGLGSLPKSDIDALVMHLLDQYGDGKGTPLAKNSNQNVSELLRTPVTKIRKLRYDAALKFGGRIEDQATAKLLFALSNASFESDGENIYLIIEDLLAKNWLQGQLKIYQQPYDFSFNSEIIKVNTEGLFLVLDKWCQSKALDAFKTDYRDAKTKKTQKNLKDALQKLAKKSAEGVANELGGAIAAFMKLKIASM